MCVMSMIYDHYNPRIPNPDTKGGIDWSQFCIQPTTESELRTAIAELRQVIADFREAVQAAAKVDLLTKQADCFDPDKAKLNERIAELEKRLAQTGAY